MTRISNETFDGHNLAASQSPAWSWASRALVASLAAAMIFTLTGIVLRHLNMAETAYQLASRV